MEEYKAKIGELESLAGCLNPAEKIKRRKAEEELDQLRSELECKKEIIKYLGEQEFAARDDQEVSLQICPANMQSLFDEVGRCKEKSEILKTFVGVMHTDDFAMTKLANEVERYRQEFWHKLQPIYEKRAQVSKQLDILKAKEEECLELQKKAQTSMLSSPA